MLTYSLATGSIPFVFVENPYFRQFVEVISGGKYKLLHRTAIRDRMISESARCDKLVRQSIAVSINIGALIMS